MTRTDRTTTARTAATASPREIILIAGMHRSGTSLVAECIGALGWSLPRDRKGPAPDNARGHFEPSAVVALNDDLLAERGRRWDGFGAQQLWPHPADGEAQSVRVADRIASAVRTSFGPSRRVVLKDPRLGLLAPEWRGFLKQTGIDPIVLVALRDPRLVAASLFERNRVPGDLAAIGWIEHTLGALDLAAGHRQGFVAYPDWLACPGGLAHALAALTRDSTVKAQRMAAFAASVRATPRTRPTGCDGTETPAMRLALDLFLHCAASECPDAAAAGAAEYRDRAEDLIALPRLAAQWAETTLAAEVSGADPAVEPPRRILSRTLASATKAVAEAADLRRGLAATTDRIRVAQADAAARLRDAKALQKQLAATERQRDQAHRESKARLCDSRALESLLRQTEAQRDRALLIAKERNEDNVSLIAQVAATESQRDLAVVHLEQARSAAVSLSASHAKAEETSREAAERSALSEAARGAANRQLAELQSAFADLTFRLEAAQYERDTAVKQLAGAQSTASALAVQIAATEAQRDDARHTNDTLVARVDDVETRLSRFRDTETTLRNRLSRALLRLRAARADARAKASMVSALTDERDAFELTAAATEADLRDVRRALDDATARLVDLMPILERELMTVARPIYRKLYRYVGQTLRQHLPEAQVEAIKRRIPAPGGLPPRLALPLHVPTADPMNGTAPVAPRDSVADLPDIFVLSIINWSFRTQRPQHLARAWAARGHRVFYVEMECDRAGPRLAEIAPRLHVIRLGADGMPLIPTYSGRPGPDHARSWTDRLLQFCDTIAASPRVHVVIQHPYWWEFARHLPPMFQLTFDCMDDIAGFSNSDAAVIAAERAMIAGVDRMIVSAETLARKYGPASGGRALSLVRNGADIRHFVRPDVPPPPAFLKGRFRVGAALRVGYVGAIAEWFDAELLAEVAGLLPDADFHLCGAVTSNPAMALASLPNVTLHGEIAYADVPGFLEAMDVMIIPFRLDPIILACDPVKFYEYAAAMRPVVATSMPELARAGDLVRRAETAGAFAEAIRQAAGDGKDPGHRAALRAYAEANSWETRATTFLTAIEAAPSVSVVILSFGDPALARGAVHSLLGEGRAYPTLEVIVVDNGSPPDTVADLRDYLSGFPEARLIEAGANLGFAAGNNLGIRVATGDYVMLLNNDTCVAPGAVAAMVRHLDRDPGIGVVGPLTNNIGNEARVAVDYADMAAMRRSAQRLTTGYRGQATEMRVAAYFCVMFRRADLARFGPLDEDYGLGMFEDDDHCAVIRARGLRCALAEDAFVHHHLSASFDRIDSAERHALFARNKVRFEARWGPWVPHRYRASRPPSSLDRPAPTPKHAARAAVDRPATSEAA